MTKKRQLMFTLLRSALAIGIALLVALILIFISSEGKTIGAKAASSLNALKQMLIGPLFKTNSKGQVGSFQLKRLTDVLAAMIPTMFTGLSISVMFSANQFNLGAEGGCMLGGFIAGLCAVYVGLPAGLHPLFCVLMGGFVAGAAMLIPALLKANSAFPRWCVH